MKMGIRTPNVKKSFKARTTGKAKRTIKKSVNPLYGKKGMGYVNNPKKAVYNKVYSKTTISAVPKTFDNSAKKENKQTTEIYQDNISAVEMQEQKPKGMIFLWLSIAFYILFAIFIVYIIRAMIKYPLARKAPFNYIVMIALFAIAIGFQKIYKLLNK